MLRASLIVGIVLAALLPFQPESRCRAEPLEVADVVIISRSTSTQSPAGERSRYYNDIETGLLYRLEQELLDRGLAADPAGSGVELRKQAYKHLLAFTLEDVEFGLRHPLGRHTNLKVNYILQDAAGKVLATGRYKEHSNQGWKNCVRSVSKRIAGTVADQLAGKEGVREPIR